MWPPSRHRCDSLTERVIDHPETTDRFRAKRVIGLERDPQQAG
jgi:hypothetical protein